jgi:hypothetical protein
MNAGYFDRCDRRGALTKVCTVHRASRFSVAWARLFRRLRTASIIGAKEMSATTPIDRR